MSGRATQEGKPVVGLGLNYTSYCGSDLGLQ